MKAQALRTSDAEAHANATERARRTSSEEFAPSTAPQRESTAHTYRHPYPLPTSIPPMPRRRYATLKSRRNDCASSATPRAQRAVGFSPDAV
eukprot:4253207-Pleurochrysis_carterae.AAC.1